MGTRESVNPIKEVIIMTNYREILRLSSLGFNNTQITQSCRVLPNHRHSDAEVGAGERFVFSLAGRDVGQTAC